MNRAKPHAALDPSMIIESDLDQKLLDRVLTEIPGRAYTHFLGRVSQPPEELVIYGSEDPAVAFAHVMDDPAGILHRLYTEGEIGLVEFEQALGRVLAALPDEHLDLET